MAPTMTLLKLARVLKAGRFLSNRHAIYEVLGHISLSGMSTGNMTETEKD